MRPTLRRATTTLAAAALAGAAVVAGGTGTPAAHAGTGTGTGPAPRATAWTDTLTQGLRLSGTPLGATPSRQPVHLTIALTPRHAAAMKQAIAALYDPASPRFHHYLTAAQWRHAYAPSAGDVAAVTRYLRGAGLTGLEVAPNRLAVTAEGTAAQAERAFHTSLVSSRVGGRTLFANLTAAQVPDALAGVVSAVTGLNDVPLDAVRPQVARTKTGALSTSGLYPAGFRRTYDATGTRPGTRTSIAVLSEGVTKPVIASLRHAEKAEHARKVPVTVVKAGAQSKDTSGADEFDMDTQASTIMAGAVKRLYLYNIGSLSDSQVVYGITRFVGDDKAQAMSASIGGCEYAAYLDGSELAVDTAMQEAAMQGQSLFASSGDEGDACAVVANTGTPVGVPQDEWPAVGEFDTAVGGTSLLADKDGNRIKELAWLGGGGGDSEFELPGPWTQDTDPGYVTELATGGRAVPDVALDADPNLATPAKVYVGTKVVGVGGTSLSSPLMLGIWARLESAHHNKLGLASIPLYRVYDKVNPGRTITTPLGVSEVVPALNPKPVKGFTDITLGSNGLYQATPGWDYTTGLGAPDVKRLVEAIR